MAGEPSFFELGVADAVRGRTFYGSLFGWTFESGTGDDGFAVATGGLPGGLHGGDAGDTPYLFFRTDDLNAAAARVRELGGTVEDPREEREESVARFGRFRACRDNQGSPFGLHEPPKTSSHLAR